MRKKIETLLIIKTESYNIFHLILSSFRSKTINLMSGINIKYDHLNINKWKIEIISIITNITILSLMTFTHIGQSCLCWTHFVQNSILKHSFQAGDVAQKQSTCLACARLWVQYPVPQK
jgi:hypothetical protein